VGESRGSSGPLRPWRAAIGIAAPAALAGAALASLSLDTGWGPVIVLPSSTRSRRPSQTSYASWPAPMRSSIAPTRRLRTSGRSRLRWATSWDWRR